MKICIVSPGYPQANSKGGYFFVQQLVNQFANMGNDCVVIAPINVSTRFFVKSPAEPAYEEHVLKSGKIVKVFRPRFYGRSLNLMGVSWKTWAAQRAIEKVIESNKLSIDCFYCHFFRSGILPFRYAKVHNIPLFVATGESQIPSVLSPYRGFEAEEYASYLNGVISVSTKNKDEAIALKLTTEKKCKVFPNGVDLSLFTKLDRIACRNGLGLKEDDFVVICVGNFQERKGQNRLISAVEKIGNSNIKLILLGNGDTLRKSDCVYYKGFCRHEELPKYLNAADVYAIPTRWEGCCNSIIEAMACGLPVVSSDRPFNYDVLDKSNSILVDPDNIDEISKAINTLYSDRGLCKSMGESSLTKALSLSIENRAKSIISYINENK